MFLTPKDNEYETLVFTYNRELDSLILANCVIRSLEEEKNSPPHKKCNDEFKKKLKVYFPTIPWICCYELGRHDLDAYTTIHNGFQRTQRFTNGT
jgi:hypothetical protein